MPLVVVLDHDDPENEAAYLPERFSARAPFAQVRFSWTEAGTVAAVWGHRGHEGGAARPGLPQPPVNAAHGSQ